jgi:prophage regulatory protein
MNEKLYILRRKQVEERTGLSRSSIYLAIQQGTFPMQISLGSRAVGWLEHEISEWVSARIEKRDNEHESQLQKPNYFSNKQPIRQEAKKCNDIEQEKKCQ